MFRPTKKQQEVLDIKHKNIAVSASAGSGKTSVMIEKIADYITKDEIQIKNLLVVTFTNSASVEMKERLSNKLAELIAKEKDQSRKKFLIKQVEDLENADICTIDKFCLNVLRKYYYLLDLDGNFNILEETEEQKLKIRAFDLCVKNLTHKNPTLVNELCDAFLESRSLQNLKTLVENFVMYLSIQEDRENFLQNVLFCLYDFPISENAIYKQSVKELQRQCAVCATRFKISMAENISVPKVQEALSENLKICEQIATMPTQAVHNFCGNVKVFTLGNVSKGVENKEEIVKSINILQNAINEYDKVFCLDFTLDELQRQAIQSKDLVEKLVLFIDEYQCILLNLKKENNAFTFADIEYFAYKLLKILEIQQTFVQDIDLIFVDEYQDVNKLQERLISQIAKQNNLFVVGDIKQSIYAFRLSEPKYFEYKIKDYASEQNKDSEQKNLNENFRSDKDILDFINLIFEKIMTIQNSNLDYKNTSMLEGKNSFTNNQNLPKVDINLVLLDEEEKQKNNIYSVQNHNDTELQKQKIEKEAQLIANKVAQYVGTKITDKDGKTYEINYRDIAVLFRSKKELYEAVLEKLKELNIPVNASFNADIYSSYECKFLCNFMSTILSIYDDFALSGVLSFPCMNISSQEMLDIATIDSETSTFCNKAIKYSLEKSDELSDKLRDLFDFVAEMKKFAVSHNLYELTCEIIKKYDLENLLSTLPNGKIYKNNLKRFLQSLNANPNQSLAELVSFVQCKNAVKKDVSIGGDENSVSLMTIHKSKGLEYRVVILANSGASLSKHNSASLVLSDCGVGADCVDYEKRIKIPTFIKKHINSLEKLKQYQEEKRLLYVALTRAKNFLITTGTIKNNFLEKYKNYVDVNGDSYLYLILCALNDFELVKLINDRELDKPEIHTSFKIISEVESGEISKKVKIFGCKNDALVQNFSSYFTSKYPYKSSLNISAKSSVSAILMKSHEKECFNPEPVKLQVDEHIVTSNEIGTSYHKCLELLDFKKQVSICDAEQSICEAKRLGFDVSEVRAELLVSAYEKISSIISDGCKIRKEQSFVFKTPYNAIYDCEINDEVLVQGVIDLLIIEQNKISVIDYKNTKIKDVDKLKQRYAKQLELYALAVKLGFNIENVQTYIYNIQTTDLIKL